MGPLRLTLPDPIRADILTHCQSVLPYEGCGLFAVGGPPGDDQVTRIYPTRNLDRSGSSFTVPPGDHYAALIDSESRGWRLGGSFHSHPVGPPRPSDRDIAMALEPEWTYLVVGMSGPPEITGWRIVSGRASEVRLV